MADDPALADQGAGPGGGQPARRVGRQRSPRLLPFDADIGWPLPGRTRRRPRRHRRPRRRLAPRRADARRPGTGPPVRAPSRRSRARRHRDARPGRGPGHRHRARRSHQPHRDPGQDARDPGRGLRAPKPCRSPTGRWSRSTASTGAVVVEPAHEQVERAARQRAERAARLVCRSRPGPDQRWSPGEATGQRGRSRRRARSVGGGGRGHRAAAYRVPVPRSARSADRRGTAGYLRRDPGQDRGRKVVVRTLDAGADKPLAFASQGPSPTRRSASAACASTASCQPCSTPSSGAGSGGQGHRR